jgi:transposase
MLPVCLFACACEPKPYPSELTDAQWDLIAAMVEPRPGGRPATYSRRRIVVAILYLNRTGCSWRQLPHDFPPCETVYWLRRPACCLGQAALPDRTRDRPKTRGQRTFEVLPRRWLVEPCLALSLAPPRPRLRASNRAFPSHGQVGDDWTHGSPPRTTTRTTALATSTDGHMTLSKHVLGVLL